MSQKFVFVLSSRFLRPTYSDYFPILLESNQLNEGKLKAPKSYSKFLNTSDHNKLTIRQISYQNWTNFTRWERHIKSS